jgi:hypothetical protein
MPDGLARIYWDACVLLSYINGIPDRLPDLEWYLERSGKGFQLVTSTVTIVEGSLRRTGKGADGTGCRDRSEDQWFVGN